jgi:CRP/FNR family cyclic AMP-dependent transcriptional regulator
MAKRQGGKRNGNKPKQAFDSEAFLATVNGGRAKAEYKKKQIIFRQGDPADAVFYVQSGGIKLTVLSDQGKEAVVAMVRKGEFFGEGCLAAQPKRMASATALAPSEILRISKKTILRMLHEEPAFMERFMAHLLKRNIQVEEDLVDQLFNSSEKRLARLLLVLGNFGKDAQADQTLGKISQETLAEMIGTTRARVSHFMNKFRRLGLIDYNGHIEVRRALLNVVLHEKPHIKGKQLR